MNHRRIWMALAVPVWSACIVATFTTLRAVEPRGPGAPARRYVRDGGRAVPGYESGSGQPEGDSCSRADRTSATYVRNRDVAIVLGKALFWDMQVGSDGVQACASCHFRAGADPRSINQVNPGGADNPDPTIDLADRTISCGRRTSRCTSSPIRPTGTRRCCATSTTSCRRRACTCGSSWAWSAARSRTSPCRYPTRCSASTASTRAGRSRATRRR